MKVHLTFNQSQVTSFDDWIVVGTNNDEQCHHRGRGERSFIIEIPLINDPCGTKMVSFNFVKGVV